MASKFSDVRTDGKPMSEKELPPISTEHQDNDPIIVYEDCESKSDVIYTERKWDYLDPYEYEYDKNDPGYILIINNSENRIGTEFDVEEIVKCFGRQGYNVGSKNIINDPTKEELFVEVARVCADELNDTNSLFVFVLSHGEVDNKFKVNGEGTVSIEELVKPFLNLLWFKNKPKMFIFQTCKTNDDQRKEQLRTASTTGQENIKLYVDTTLTAEPNLLLFCSTLEGDFAYRDKKRGSWFIQELCRNIYTHGHREEILSILTRCNKCLAKNYYYKGDDILMNLKQTPIFISTLTSNFYVNRSKDRYFYIEKMNELKNALAIADDLKNYPTRRTTLY